MNLQNNIIKKYTPENITKLLPNEVFVFGDNEAGIHGAGAALIAFKKFGAVWGIHDALRKQSYGISTKDKNLNVLSLHKIQNHVNKFIKIAKSKPFKTFYVTKIGCGLAGYKPKEIAPLFKECIYLNNVILPKEFIEEIDKINNK